MSFLDKLLRRVKHGASTIKNLNKRFHQGPTAKDLSKRMVLDVVKQRRFPSWAQWKHLPKSLSAPEKFVAATAIFLIILSAIFLAGHYIILHQTTVPAVGGEYTEGLIGNPQFINPLYSPTSDVDMDLTKLVYSGLLKYDQKEGLVTDLAESYDISDDGLIYTFVLRDNVFWHDGEPLKVNDVISTFAMIQNAEYKSPLIVSFKEISVIQVDKRTVRFILPEPFAPFLSTLTVGILPAHIWQSVPAKNATLADANLRPIGTGPYKFDKFTKDKVGNIKSYTLVRNNNYYSDRVNLETITFKFYNDSSEALDALKNKNIEGVGFIPSERLEEFSENKDLSIFTPFIPQYTALFFNEVNQEILKSTKVRQALAKAVNKDQIIEQVLHGRGRKLEGPFLKGMIGYTENLDTIQFDLDEAEKILNDAGWILPDGKSVRTKGSGEDAETLTLELVTINNPDFIATAETIKKQWGLIGVEVILNIVDIDTLQTQILKERTYDVILSGELLGFDPDPYAFWHSSQIDYPGLNISLYANRKADTLIEEARSATDNETRVKKYRELQEMLIEDIPAVFLYQPTYAYAVSSKVKGVNIQEILIPANRFAKITDWYVKTKRVLQ